MSHANAALTPRARLRLARLIVDDGWPPSVAAKMFMVSTVTARKWAIRFRAEGVPGMRDRSSRPLSMPAKTPLPVVKRIVKARWRRRLGPVQIAGELGLAPSTVHAVLVRCRVNRLSRIDRVTGEPIRRYEHDHPGSLIHVDVTKFGNIPDGGGHRFLGRAQGTRNRHAMAGVNRNTRYQPRLGIGYLHTVIDDHSRVAYVEMHADERSDTAIGVLRRAVAWFAERGVTVERVLSDNGAAYRSFAWRDACSELGIKHKRTRPYRPQTNGKIERFHRTLADGWAYAKLYTSETERRDALPGWIHFYNQHRATLRDRRPANQQAQQPPWTSQLDAVEDALTTVLRKVTSRADTRLRLSDTGVVHRIEASAASGLLQGTELKRAISAIHDVGQHSTRVMLSHGDLHRGNILISKRQFRVIDWQSAETNGA